MCDSGLTVSCLTDFTSYCPANALGDANIGPRRCARIRHRLLRSQPKPKTVRSKEAVHKSQGRGLTSKVRIRALGEESEDSCVESSDDSDEEFSPSRSADGRLQSFPQLKSEPISHCLTDQELRALKGCVTRGRALFSPSTKVDVRDATFPPKRVRKQSRRRGSLEYDHLENFVQGELSPEKKKLESYAVSIQFEPTGHESPVICDHARKEVHQSKARAFFLPDECSQSIPSRLNSPNLKFSHYRYPSAVESLSKTSGACSAGHSPIVSHLFTPVCAGRYLQVKDQLCSPFSQGGKRSMSLDQESSANYCSGDLPVDAAFDSTSLCNDTKCGDNSSKLLVKDPGSHGSNCSLASSTWSCRSGSTSSHCERQHASLKKGVDGSLFRERTDELLSCFEDFNDHQRNLFLMKLLEKCNCVQMHLLSLYMEPILHLGCPHNCQDILSWLPHPISFQILSLLDPVSLTKAAQVSHTWCAMTNNPKLWMSLCKHSEWRLSPAGEAKQLLLYTVCDGSVQWKKMFAERYRLRRNWLKGYCTVRTFEGHTQGISCVQFDDTRIVSGSWDKTIKVWNRRTNTAWAALTLAGHSGIVRCLHLHANRLVSGSSDRTIKVWDLATDKVGWVGAACRATMVGHMHTVRCLQADDDKVISGSYDHTLKIWDIKTGRCRNTLRGHTDAVLCLQFDDRKVVSGSKDSTIKVWCLPSGDSELTLHGHQAAVTCLQFDDRRIISGALDRLIKIWKLTTGECICTMDWIRSEGHTGVVRHLQADSWKIVSAADDKTLKVWSVESGERLLTLKSHTDGVTCLQFNDQVIVSGSYDKTVKLWDFSVC